jgi:hypothetical protein
MNLAEPTHWFDRARTVTAQRWALIAVAVAAAVAASSLTGVEAGHANRVVLTLVFATALAATARPDLHTALMVETIVVWYWFAETEDRLTPWAMPVGLCLFVFHTGVALMSVAPASAIIDRTVIWRWMIRSGYVVIATVAVWLVVVVLAERRAPGSAALTGVAFVTLTGLVLVARVRSAPSGADDDRPTGPAN